MKSTSLLALRRCVSFLGILILGSISSPAASRADLLAGAPFASAVFRYSDSGSPSAGGVDQLAGGLTFTSGVTTGPDDNIYVSSYFTGEVLYYDGATGQPLPSPHLGGRDGLFATMPLNPPIEPGGDPQVASPGPLRFGPDGNLYVADQGGTTVRKFHGASGVYLDDAAIGLAAPAGLTFGVDNALYVGNFQTSDVVRVHNGVQTTFIPQFSGGLQTPSSLLFLASGELLVVDMFGDQILKYGADGTFIEQFALIELDLGENPPEPRDPTDNPSDLGYDAYGNLILAVLGPTRPPSPTYGALLKFDLQGGAPIEIISNETPLSSYAWIRSVSHVAGDYDSNSSVGPSDYTRWSSHFGQWVARGGGADGNANGIVDAADYVLWRKAASASAAGGRATVPEPCATVLVLFALALMLVHQPRHG